MKKSFLCIFSVAILSLMMSFSSVMGQQISNFNVRNASLKDVIQKLERITKVGFFYESESINLVNGITISEADIELSALLDKILKDTKLKYELIDNNIVIKEKSIENKSTQVQQQKKVTYNIKVVNQSTKSPVIGALVLIHGTTVGGICNDKGMVVINNAPENAILEISCVGMKTKLLTVSALKTSLTIGLEEDVISMEDIVVTGYQKISKERATGSFDAINKEQLAKPSTSLEQRLIGSVSGIQIIDNGYRDREESIVIRGVTSLGANSNPLIIVDGFAIEGSLSSINPNDIDNITVLKDAAAASIWGARSANGVIVVTTKAASKGKVTVDVNAFVKIGTRLDLDYANPLASSRETIEYEKLGFSTNFFGGRTLPIENNYVSGIYNGYGRMYSQGVVAMNESRLGLLKGDLNSELERLAGLDNRQQIRDYILQRPITQQYNITISGGGEKLSNVLTLMYEDSDDYFQKNNDKKYSLNYRANIDVFKWLNFSFSSMFQYDNNNNSGLSVADIQYMSPYDMLVDDSGKYLHIQRDIYKPIVDRYITDAGVQFPYADWSYNPVQELAARNITAKNLNARFQAGLNFKLMKGLTFDTKLQYELMENRDREIYSDESYAVRFYVNNTSTWDGKSTSKVRQNVASGDRLTEGSSNLNAYNFRNQLTFDRTFKKHGVSVIVGTEVSNRIFETTQQAALYGYQDELLSVTPPLYGVSTPTNPINNMFNASTSISYPTPRKSYAVDKYFSMYANASYTFNSKYTLSGSFRTDASNLISSDPSIRYSPFWSVGGLWIIDREDFMKKTEWIDRLVLRATYGFNGNVDKSTSVDPLISIWGQDTSSGTGYGVIANYGNPDLGWEKTGSFNIGIDYTLLDNKLFGKIDYYNKQGRDLISNVALANVYGTDTQEINAVSMYNKGIELTVGTMLMKNRFSWTGNLSLAYNKNKITELFKDDATLNNRVYGPGSGWQYAEGYDSGTLWAFRYGGMQNLGGVNQPVIVDKNGENPRPMNVSYTSFNSKNYLVDAGTSVAPYVVGLNSTFKYDNFSFSFIITGYFGHKFKRTSFNYPTMSTGTGAINKYYSEVKNGDPNEFIPIPEKGSATYSTLGYYAGLLENKYVDAGNIRFQEINLTYDLPRTALSKIGLGNLSVYAQLNNVGVVVFNKYGEDPFYPMGKVKPGISYTFGAKLKF